MGLKKRVYYTVGCIYFKYVQNPKYTEYVPKVAVEQKESQIHKIDFEAQFTILSRI